jgi:YidC/Oxa1 family membrane protein insertase
MNLFTAPFVNALFGLYYLVGNFGWAVILVTIIIKLILFPLVWPSLKSAQKIREVQPKLNKLKEKYGKDKQAMAKAQMDLYKQEGINPLAGCLPQILQIAVLLLFFSAFNMVTGFSGRNKGSVEQINAQLVPSFRIDESFKFNLNFFGSDLSATPSKLVKEGININLLLPAILLLGSGVLQFFSAKLMMPPTALSEIRKGKTPSDTLYTKETPGKEDDMMATMRTQSMYMMPAMTIFIGWNFSLGMLLYWFTTSVLMIGQQVLVNKVNKK